MTGSSRLLALAVVALLAVTVLPATVPAGTEEDPEVEDPCDDAGAGPVGVTTLESLDIGGLWYEWKPVEGIIEQYLDICHNDIRHRRARSTLQTGWTVNWTDGRGREWSQRIWGTGLLSDKTGITYQLCQGREKVEATDKAALNDGVAKLTINNALDQTRFEEAIRETYVVAGRFPPPSEDHEAPREECELGFAEVFDRAPDEDFGEIFELEARQKEPEGHGLELSAPAERTVRAGTTLRVDLEFNNTLAKIRNVTLTLEHDLPSDWPVVLEPRGISMPPKGDADATLALRPPRTAPDADHRLRVDALVRNGTLVRKGRLNATLDLHVDGHTFRPAIPTEPSGPTTPPGAIVEHEVRIANAGTARDTFRLEVHGDPPGWVHLPTDRVTLGADGTRDLTLKIRVPGDAEPGWYEHTLTATSAVNPDAVAETRIVTGVALTDDGVIEETGATLPTLPAPGAWGVVAAAGLAAVLVGRRD